MPRVAELAFILSPGQNWFFVDLVATLREELERQGVPSTLHTEGFPEPRPDLIYVLAPPHEFAALEGEGALPGPELLSRSLFICAEQPGTVHFEDNVKLAQRGGITFDINQWATELMGARGVAARRLQVGWSPRWDHFDPERERDIDILVLASQTTRRLRFLASYGRVFSRWNCHIQLSDNSAPNVGAGPGFVTDAKWDLLGRSKVIINLHQGEEPYFEWLRALDAIHGGAVLVSEHSLGIEPLVPHQHLFVGRPESLGLIADGLLHDEPRLQEVRQNAYSFVRESLPFAAGVGELARAAEELAARPFPVGAVAPSFSARDPEAGDGVVVAPVAQPTETSALRAGVKATRIDMMSMRRQLARIEAILRSPKLKPPPRTVQVAQTEAFAARHGVRVSVLIALYNHSDTIVDALDSLAATGDPDFEVVVTDDGSNDGSGDAVAAWMREHEDIPALLVRHPINAGLGTARNTAREFSRGEYCLILDSDNAVYPRCIETLAAVLDQTPEVDFVYPMLEAFGSVDAYVAGGGAPMVSVFGWDPRRLRKGNFVDAFSMIRASALSEVGGYTTDSRLYGWEDYDLWCKMAEAGKEGLLVPQMLARYRTSPASMQWTTNISTTAAVAALVERHPNLMEGVLPPP
jgi:GT2 family glycosyltransferase